MNKYSLIKTKTQNNLGLVNPMNFGLTLNLGKKEQKRAKREEVARLRKALDDLMSNLESESEGKQ